MLCKLCNKEIPSKFYLHLNSNHHLTKTEYLARFPEQLDEYNKQIGGTWNKGLTAENNASVAKYAEAIKEHTNRPEVRLQRSERLKARYARGDILTPEVRELVVRAGSQAWANKLQQMTKEERTNALKKFTQAGNDSQERRRPELGPDDYNRLYPFAKGIAVYLGCHSCGKRMIAWVGGDTKKPRPKRKFCSRECWSKYIVEHHGIPGGCHIVFRSEKMNEIFYLRSWLEVCMAAILEESDVIATWRVPTFFIKYALDGEKKYYPDFLVNDSMLVEVKSEYMRKMRQQEVKVKNIAAKEYCQEKSWRFFYLEFGRNMTKKKMLLDERLERFLEIAENAI